MSPTSYLPPQAVISNGVITGIQWGTPDNIFFVDQNYAISNVNTGTSSDFCIGNFNFNIPVGSIINGIQIEIIGHRGAQTSPLISLSVSAFDDTNGANNYYPYTSPITSLTPTDSTIIIGGPTYLFATTWTVDMINNFKLSLTGNGDISLDSVLVKVYFTPPATNTFQYNTLVGTFQVGETITDGFTGATGVIVTDNGSDEMTVTNVVGFFQPGDPITGGTSGATAFLDAPIPGVCIDCSSPIQVQAMELELPFLVGQTTFFLKKGSFVYPNGIPVQPGDIGSCGGIIPFVFDEGKPNKNGQNFEENAVLDTNNGGSWNVLPSGVIQVNLGAVTQRGLDFKTPANHVDSNMSTHDANSKVIISNNEPYNLTLVRTCQADTVFSPPISVYNDGALLTASLHTLKLTGPGKNASLTALHEVTVDVPGGGSGGSGGGNIRTNQTPDNGTYGLLAGAVNGTNTTFTVADGSYVSGTLVVYLNGLIQLQGASDDFVETSPGSGTFDFNIAPLTGDIITVTYQINTFFIDQTPLGTGSTYGLLAGVVNGINTVFTVSKSVYVSGSLTVFLNGLMQFQGAGDDWVETSPSLGTFTFDIAPLTGDIITVQYSI